MMLSAQVSDQGLTSSIIEVVTHPNLQNNQLDKMIVLETAKLEDQYRQSTLDDVECLTEVPQDVTCEDLKESLVPEGLKQKGWKVLFEAKYIPVDDHPGNQRIRGSANVNLQRMSEDLDWYYRNQTEPALLTEQDFQAELLKIQNSYPSAAADNYIGALLLRQLQQTENYDQMMDRFKELSKGLTDQQYLQFLTAIGGWAEYNDDRASFSQSQGAGLGRVGPFEQIIGTQTGVCGDIHSMVAKFAEQRGWEAFTVGYALEGEQHVVTAVVDPNNKDKLMVVNYGRYEEQALNNGNSVLPTPTNPGSSELGMQMRIFKNNAKNGGDGQMQQLAQVPTALGSFMNTLFQKQGQIKGAMAENENFRREKVDFEYESQKIKTKKNGKIQDRLMSEGISIYEGQTDNAHIYGIAVSHNVYKNLYSFDPKQKKCVPKKSKYFSAGVAGSLIDLPYDQLQDNFYVYLNIKGGQILNLYQTEHFQFKGFIGYELEGFAAFYKEGGLLTADGNLAVFSGVMAEYQKNNTALYGGVSLETNVTLKDQNLMTDFSALPKNIAPFNFNALKVDAGLQQKLNDKMTFVTNNQLLISRVGNRVILSTGIIHQNTSLMLSYQGGMKSLNIGNSLQSVNLLQNFNQTDGVRLTVGQNFSNRSGSLSGNFSAYGGLSTTTPTVQPFGGASLKLNINGGKNKGRSPSHSRQY
jgi:hypothetical protein